MLATSGGPLLALALLVEPAPDLGRLITHMPSDPQRLRANAEVASLAQRPHLQ